MKGNPPCTQNAPAEVFATGVALKSKFYSGPAQVWGLVRGQWTAAIPVN